MPTSKDLKKLARSRMNKTGESYTTARAQLLKKKASPPPDRAKLAGMSDRAVREKTGRDWGQWVRLLDSAGAASMTHKQIARHLHEQHEVSAWWSQTVTVGYERIKGLREVGQVCDGKFQASKSKTFPVPLSRLYKAFSVARTRRRWLTDAEPKIRTSTVDRSIRMTWPDETLVEIYFTAKGDEKAQVSIQHRKLGKQADIARAKTEWTERLTALGEVLR